MQCLENSGQKSHHFNRKLLKSMLMFLMKLCVGMVVLLVTVLFQLNPLI
jgi:hypothetical protein